MIIHYYFNLHFLPALGSEIYLFIDHLYFFFLYSHPFPIFLLLSSHANNLSTFKNKFQMSKDLNDQTIKI